MRRIESPIAIENVRGAGVNIKTAIPSGTVFELFCPAWSYSRFSRVHRVYRSGEMCRDI